MCRKALIAIAVFLLLLMAASALIVQQFGWPGFLVLVAGLVVLAFVARKSAPHMFRYMLTRPLRKLGAPLRGARLTVHSVAPSRPPAPEDFDSGPYGDDTDDEDEAVDDGEDPFDLDWYEVEFTVTPPDAGPSAGRIVHRQAWNPQTIGIVARPPEGKDPGPAAGWSLAGPFAAIAQSTPAEVWDGTDYVEPEEEVFGEKRLRLRFGVGRDVRSVIVTYLHVNNIGEIQIPRIDLDREPTP